MPSYNVNIFILFFTCTVALLAEARLSEEKIIGGECAVPGIIALIGLYKKKEYWDNLDFKTKDYHWNDRDKLYKDYLYLEQLYEKVIISCSDSLNQFHKVNYSTRYWKILIGPWLFHFIQILFDRWHL